MEFYLHSKKMNIIFITLCPTSQGIIPSLRTLMYLKVLHRLKNRQRFCVESRDFGSIILKRGTSPLPRRLNFSNAVLPFSGRTFMVAA